MNTGGGDFNVNAPRAEGPEATAAGRDATGATVATDQAEIAQADSDSAASTGAFTAKATTPATGTQRHRVAALIFVLVLIAGLALLLGGAKVGVVAIVIGGGGFALNIFQLYKGS